MDLKKELEAAALAGDFRRVVGLMAANEHYKGDIWCLLADFGEQFTYRTEYEPESVTIDGYPVAVLGTFSVAVVEYIDGTRRGIYRGKEKIFQEAYRLMEQEKDGAISWG